MIYLLTTLASLFALWRIGRRTRYFLHLYQLEGYKPNEYRAWLRTHVRHVFRTSHLVALVLLIAGMTAFRLIPTFGYSITVCLLLAWPVTFASSRLYRSHQPKKPLAYTARMKRLMWTAVVLAALLLISGSMLAWMNNALHGFGIYLATLLLIDLSVPFVVHLAGGLMRPVERHIQDGFKQQARNNLHKHPTLTVIGITGSYGKTSVKFIIAEILRQRYHVLATPGSYNTPMGICLVVNTMLKPEHQVLVLEMGARYRGDIRELCELAPPNIGVVTSVGVAHLASMGSIEAIAEEKGDLVAHTQAGGPVILNADDERVAAMAKRAQGPVWRAAIAHPQGTDLVASEVQYGPQGTRFTVQDEEGHEAVFHTQLLGAHNILNILLGLAVGRAMGLRLRQMVPAVARLQPVPHRLQLRQEGPVTIIDDAFNANPVGAHNAVTVLGQFTTGRRIIVTPGMIELGEKQWEENKRLGQHIAQHADLVLLVGPTQTAPIQEGLKTEQYPTDQIHIFTSLFEAQDHLKTILRPGDVVLYENDLPDQYNE